MKLRETFKDFYARYDVIFELIGGVAISGLAYAEKMPVWAVVTLIIIRQVCAMKGMRDEQKKDAA